MRRIVRTFVTLSLFAATAAASIAAAQSPSASAQVAMSHDEIMSFAKVYVAVNKLHDSIDVQLAAARNKTLQAQQHLRDTLQVLVAATLRASGMTQAEYDHKTYLVSTDGETRKMFDAMVSQLTGAPLPGTLPPAPPSANKPAQVQVPPGPAGVHIGHVVNKFFDTPDSLGLLPTAVAEARIAVQHAQLAARNTNVLSAMQTHAGHVINALDPTIVKQGPGRGYGVKKAATGVATHIELAAKAPGASAAVITHSVHIATAARSTVARADKIIAIAQKIQAATTAQEAASLVAQMVSLCDQLIAGEDVNGDGRITWDNGEGGLQQVQEHVDLMLKATA